MNLYDKVKLYIDYNNHYTITKAIRTLGLEFEQALKTKNADYANNIVSVIKSIYTEFNDSYWNTEAGQNTMSYEQKVLSKKIHLYINYLSQKIKSSPQKAIEQIISPQ